MRQKPELTGSVGSPPHTVFSDSQPFPRPLARRVLERENHKLKKEEREDV